MAAPLPPSRVLQLSLQRALRARRWARVGEGALCAAGVLLLTQAAAVLEGARPTEPAVLGAALLAGMLAGATWIGFGWGRVDALAAELDRELDCDGALRAAHDATRDPDRARPLTELLVARVLARSQPRVLLRRALPAPWPWLVAPLLGGLALMTAVDTSGPDAPGDGGRRSLGELARALDAALEAGLTEGAAGELGADDLDRLLELAQEGRALVLAARRAAPNAAGAEAPGLDDWIERAGDLRPALPEDSGAALERALAAAEAAQLAGQLAAGDDLGTGPNAADALAAGDPDPETTSDPGSESGPGTDDDPTGDGTAARSGPGDGEPAGPVARAGAGAGEAAGARGAEGGGPDDVPGGGSSTSGPPVGGREEGTMSGLLDPDGALPGPARDESGLALGRWWSERDAPLVRAWVEARRARR